MGTWTVTNGVFTMSGAAVRTVAPLPGTFPSNGAVKLQVGAPAHNVLACILGSRDLRTGWACGISGANAVIQHRALGGLPTVVASGPHGLTAGVPFSLEARCTDNQIALYLNGSSSPILTHDNSGAGLYARYRHCGFESDVNGAMVLSAEVCSMVQNVSPATEMLFVVCDGNLLALTSEDGVRTVAAGAFTPAVRVSLVDFEQKVYGLDGSHAVYADARTLTSALWGDSSGDGVLPGATEPTPGVYTPGTSRMRHACTFLARVLVMADPTDPQNLWGSKVADAHNWNIALRDDAGRAFGTPASVYGKIGKPIVGAIEATRRVLIIGTATGFWRMVGDPAIGVPSFDPIVMGDGLAGPEAMDVVSDGLVVAYSPTAGLILLGAVGGPVYLTRDILTEGFHLGSLAGQYDVIVRRDPARQLIHVFMTPLGGPVGPDPDATHYVYDERVGRLQAAGFGPIPDDFPARLGPTAACVWKNTLVMGTRDGRLFTWDTTNTVHDDDGDPIRARMALEILDEGEEHHETILHRLEVAMTRASGPVTYSLFGGLTAEQAWVGPDRRQLIPSGVLSSVLTPLSIGCRAGAMVIELSNETVGETFRIEHVEVATTLGERLAAAYVLTDTTPDEPARSPDGDIGADVTPTTPPPTPGPGNTTIMRRGGSTGDNVYGISGLELDDDHNGTPGLESDRTHAINHGGGKDPSPEEPPVDLDNVPWSNVQVSID